MTLNISEFVMDYNEAVSILPEIFQVILPVFFMAAMIAFYSIFVWFFYRFLAQKDVLKLNLEKYNVYEHSGILKLLRVVLYILEFMIIAPVAIFFWFAILATFITILASEIEIGTVVMICAGLIAAIRITAYFNEDLSRDLAKMVPFTLLGVAILTPNSINVETSIMRVAQLPSLLDNAAYYLMFIVGLEVFMRIFHIPTLLVEAKKRKEKKED